MMNNEKDNLLIHPYDSQYSRDNDEPVYEDFISRQEFINRTGIFVTPQYFGMFYDDFMESHMTVDEFLDKIEETYTGEIFEIPLSGTFKYMIMDDDVSCMGQYPDAFPEDLTIWEMMDSLATELYHKCIYSEKRIEEAIGIANDSIRLNEELRDTCKKLQQQRDELLNACKGFVQKMEKFHLVSYNSLNVAPSEPLN
ncbi:MAG: hypothetical protein LUF92_03745 [Clostridiales bacterium]|nr:hypothetical protein [Clostridiales bacterium]